jgi:hypothetical protein
MATMNLRLTRRWSDWSEGDVVTVDRDKGKRLIAEGFGVEDRSAEAARLADIEVRGGPPIRHPTAETATLPPAEETADRTPRKKAKPRAETAIGGPGSLAGGEPDAEAKAGD